MKIPTHEMILIGSLLRSILSADEFDAELPELSKWLNENVDQEEINSVMLKMQDRIMSQDLVSIKMDELITLYAHTIAVMGAQELNHRAPGVRALILNTTDDERMKHIMLLVKSVEDRISENE